ncbi:SMP-30/gluconolactonase/LRE family protein [Streptomyces sp. NPDC048002]|uniref:SMP-30/gluconolactonase/LRE family protein n=1 Tax=Streptomyces sp. NPDC048002 TaxID=3154344 RepID=UPI0033DE1B96
MAEKCLSLRDLPGARVLAADLSFPESPRFKDGQIFFSDLNRVCAVDLDGHLRVVGEVPTPVALGISLEDDHQVLAAATFDRQIFRLGHGKAEPALDLSAATKEPINEFVRLPNGVLLVGSMGFNPVVDGFEGARPGHMLLVTPDGTVRETGPELLFVNGLVLSQDKRLLWAVETLTRVIHRFTLDETGEIVHDDPIALPAESSPDGMTITSDGQIWFADMKRGAAVEVNPHGEIQTVVEVPEPRAPCCIAFSDRGQEWLAIGVTVHGPGEGEPGARTGRLLAVPLDSITEATADN